MPFVIALLYLVLLSFLITRSGFLKASGLRPAFLMALFLVYALAGCGHVWIAYHYYPQHGDIWNFFDESLRLKGLLLNDFTAFSNNFIPYNAYTDFAAPDSGWNYIEYQTIILLNLVLDFFSFDNLYINTILFCFFTFWAKIALFRMLKEAFPVNGLTMGLVSIVLPSILFWTTVIHKEGLLFTAFGFLLFSFHRILTNNYTIKTCLLFAGCFILVFFSRKILLIALAPSMLIWWIMEKISNAKRYAVPAVAASTIAGLALLAWLSPSLDIISQLSLRQLAFRHLEGNSRIGLPKLQDNLKSLVSVFPYAVWNGLFMPVPGTGGKFIYSLFGIELIGIWLINLGGIVYTLKSPIARWKGFDLFCLFFAITACIMVGYIVPFVGAIVRYRSILLPFLLMPFLQILSETSQMRKLNNWLKSGIVE